MNKSKDQVVKHLDLQTLLEQVEELLQEGEELLPSDDWGEIVEGLN